MDKADVIRLAQQADPEWLLPDPDMCPDEVDALERFAALVRAQVIEEAARLAEEQAKRWMDDRAKYVANECAAAIRGMKSDSGHSATAAAEASTAPLPEGER